MAQTTSVLWSVDQGLGEEEQSQARQNIGAASEKLTEVVNNHTTEIGQITESVEGIESSLTNKKDKQLTKDFNGSSTKTVTNISQDENGELNVEFEDIDLPQSVPNVMITSEDNSVQVSETTDVQTNTKKFDLSIDFNKWHNLICKPYDSTIKLTIINAGYYNGFLNFNGSVEKIADTFTTNAVNYLFTVEGISLKIDFRNYYGSGAYNSNINLFPCAMAGLKNNNLFYIFPTQICNIFYFNGTVPVDLLN